jgi:hypothetical protein
VLISAFGFENRVPKDVASSFFDLLNPLFISDDFSLAASRYVEVIQNARVMLQDDSWSTYLFRYSDTSQWLKSIADLSFFNSENANASNPDSAGKFKSKGSTNEIVKVVNGIKHRRLGGSGVVVSEIGLGTQRWVSSDFNAPDENACFGFMDEAILKSGVNLIDTAESYPIPSGGGAKEGDSERLIGKWMKDRKVNRENVVIATKITGGRNINPKNIRANCDGSLKRLGTDYIDGKLLSQESTITTF